MVKHVLRISERKRKTRRTKGRKETKMRLELGRITRTTIARVSIERY